MIHAVFNININFSLQGEVYQKHFFLFTVKLFFFYPGQALKSKYLIQTSMLINYFLVHTFLTQTVVQFICFTFLYT